MRLALNLILFIVAANASASNECAGISVEGLGEQANPNNAEETSTGSYKALNYYMAREGIRPSSNECEKYYLLEQGRLTYNAVFIQNSDGTEFGFAASLRLTGTCYHSTLQCTPAAAATTTTTTTTTTPSVSD